MKQSHASCDDDRALEHSPLRKDATKDNHYSSFAGVTPFCLASLGVTAIFTLFIFYSPPNPFTLSSNFQIHTLTQEQRDGYCELFVGQWIRDPKGSRYTNSSCKTIPSSKNCFKHGRGDSDFLKWRWKPYGCELPRFDANAFLKMVQNKKLGFIGDSVARNHMESLLCLLSQVEEPKDEYKDSEDRFHTWYFPRHNFTLKILWSKFLVLGSERVANGSATGVYDLHLDKVDPKWALNITSLDFAIISDAHWFFRQVYLHNATNLIGCVYCNEPNVTNLGPSFALRMAFRAALNHINGCKDCRGMVTLLRTFSPSQFENGTWNTGGGCQRTEPVGEEEVNWGAGDWEFRTLQLEEIQRAKRKGEKQGKRFGLLDVTRAMLMRPDGHPGAHWGNKYMKGFNDCVHWCLPGPIDAWNDFLMAVLRRLVVLSP